MHVSWLCAVLASLVACQCRDEPGNRQLEPELAVAPAVLDFGAVPLGEQVERRLEITNRSRLAARVEVAVGVPFVPGATSFTVEGGATAPLSVVFAPNSLGPGAGSLRLTAEGAAFEVPLSGEGLAACMTSAACRDAVFDPSTAVCVERVAPEGSPCQSTCLERAACRQGVCVGEALTCDDADVCTVDACGSDGGCVQLPLECPVSDPCKVAFCDPGRGCATRDVEDGTLCGRPTCEQAPVCIAGRCVTRARPNAAEFCRFTQLSAGSDRTCGVTRSGAARCWGAQWQGADWNRVTGPIVPLGFERNVSKVFAPRVCALVGSEFRCAADGGFASTPGVVDLEALALGARTWLLFADGSVVLFPPVGPPEPVADGGVTLVRGMRSGVCLGFADGGVRCNDELMPFGGPALEVITTVREVCALVAGGGVRCSRPGSDAGPDEYVDGGALALGAMSGGGPYQPTVCWAVQGGRVTCRGPAGPSHVQLPGEVVSLTRSGLAHVCALLGDGTVHCWGENSSAQLGDRSFQPEGVSVAPLAGVTQVAASPRSILFVADGGLWGWGVAVPHFDGVERTSTQSPFFLGDPFEVVALSSSRAGNSNCLVDVRGAVRCWGRERPLVTVVSPGSGAVVAWPGSSEVSGRALDAQGTLWTWPTLSPLSGRITSTSDRVRAVSEDCVLLQNGSVSCGYQAPLTQPPYVDLGHHCAVQRTGEVDCWTVSTLTASVSGPMTVAGLAPGVPRAVVGSGLGGCALIGRNGVQCWGSNARGGLGRDGPPASRAVDVAMPEPVRALVGEPGWSFCALLASGRLHCWGVNGGWHGVAPLFRSTTPVRVD